jgi:hypothetical protein
MPQSSQRSSRPMTTRPLIHPLQALLMTMLSLHSSRLPTATPHTESHRRIPSSSSKLALLASANASSLMLHLLLLLSVLPLLQLLALALPQRAGLLPLPLLLPVLLLLKSMLLAHLEPPLSLPFRPPANAGKSQRARMRANSTRRMPSLGFPTHPHLSRQTLTLMLPSTLSIAAHMSAMVMHIDSPRLRSQVSASSRYFDLQHDLPVHPVARSRRSARHPKALPRSPQTVALKGCSARYAFRSLR